MERDRVEEVDDLDPVPRRLESPAELLGRAIMARAHGRGDDEDAPAHGTRDYRPAGMAAVLLALGAALAYAAASVLQQREAQRDTGPDGHGTVGGGVRLVLRLARRPVWLAGLAADGLGYGLQALALGVGELLVVQPVITSGILFALPLSAWWAGRRLGRAEFAWACILAIGLTVFVLLAGTDGGRDFASTRGVAGVRRDRDTGAARLHRRRFPVGGHAARGAVRVHGRRGVRPDRRAHEVDGRTARPPRLRSIRSTGSRTRSSCSGHRGSS